MEEITKKGKEVKQKLITVTPVSPMLVGLPTGVHVKHRSGSKKKSLYLIYCYCHQNWFLELRANTHQPKNLKLFIYLYIYIFWNCSTVPLTQTTLREQRGECLT